ncbi:MAG TPA: CHASE2 domain-containing protein, partial [Allocoleopsis sp.]
MKQKINIFWQQWKGLLFNATSMGGMVILGIYLGIFQLSELGIYDLFVRIRPQDKIEDKIVIVTINESDIQYFKRWPISDENLAKVLQIIIKNEPVGIGLDLIRDLPVDTGNEKLNQLFKDTPNIIGVETYPIRG